MSRAETGSATVQAIAVSAALVVVAVTCLQVAFVIGLRQRAATAADLAALAATRTSVEGGEPCAVAHEVAADNDVRVRECRMDADVATVTVRASGPRWWFGRWSAEQQARAAPAWYLE